MSMKKRALQIALFLVIMLLTFYALFSGSAEEIYLKSDMRL